MEIVYILLGIVALVVLYFAFFKKPEEAPPPAQPRATSPRPAVAKKREPQPEEPEEAYEPVDERESPIPELAAAPPERVSKGPPPAPSSAAKPIFTRGPDVQGLRRGLTRSREATGFFGRLKELISGKTEIHPDIVEDIEEALLTSDVGVQTTQTILDRVRERLSKSERLDQDKVWEALREECTAILDVSGKAGPFLLRGKPTVVLMIGVNGAGKTTTIGKLATRLKDAGLTCVLAAGDTFRAAAVQQLVVWGKRVGCEVVRGKDGADPGSVIFDAIKKAEEIHADIVLADTAGRLHTKTNLMAEMQKIARTAAKALDGAPHETLLVIDATNGQNALAQAQEFKQSLDLSGIVLTKLDGTAKGGVILGISDTLGLPVRFVGVGERPDDLHDFSPRAFVEALLGRDDRSNGA